MSVQLLAEIGLDDLRELLKQYGLSVELIADGQAIPGSFWGEPEAGLIQNRLYVRLDTPVHSALHEASHWICMDEKRRESLHTDAGGDVMEECAVNYLQILLAERLPTVGKERMMDDMTTWGYSYREGNVRAWMTGDGLDAKAWLIQHHLLTNDGSLVTQA